MNLSESIKSVLSKYAVFSGRARRSEYNYYIIAVNVFYFVLFELSASHKSLESLASFLIFATLVPTYAVACRRLHDANKSGATYLLCFVPIVNFYIIYILMFKRGDEGDNRFGPDPKSDSGAYGGYQQSSRSVPSYPEPRTQMAHPAQDTLDPVQQKVLEQIRKMGEQQHVSSDFTASGYGKHIRGVDGGPAQIPYAAAPETAPGHCVNFGAELESGASFCKWCGTKI